MAIEGLDAMLPAETTAFLPQVALVSEKDADWGPTLDAALASAGLDERGGRSGPKRLLDPDALIPDLWLSPGFHPSRRIEVDHDEALSPLRKLDVHEMALIAGGSGSDMNGEGDSIPGATVYGWRYWDWSFPDNDPGEQYPPGTGGGQTGFGTSSQEVAVHTQDCGTEDGAAVQVAKHVTGVPTGAGPPNPIMVGGLTWQQAEFGAVIVRNADGTYGALNDTIYSNGSSMYVVTPDAQGTNAVGIWHNHIDRGDANQDAIDCYPSASNLGQRSDWDALQELKDSVAPNDPSFDPSLWIMGPDGVTREFKLSERAILENLSSEQMAARVGLEGRERTQSCS